MTKYVLHGGFTSAKNKLNETFYKEITEDLSDESNVLLIYFSRDPEEWYKLFAQDKKKVLKNTNCNNLNIVCATKEDFIDQVKAADTLYIRGGNTKKVLRTLREYSSFTENLEGKTLAGSSAGAYVWSTYYHSATSGEISEGLGLLPIKIICHYGSSEFPEADKRAIDKFEEYPNDLELVVLRDYEWRIFKS